MKYNFLPYDKKLVTRTRELRANQTEAEKFFWHNIIKSKEFENLIFLRQKPIGPFIVDFYCSKLKLVIEIDGDVHLGQKGRDKERDAILKELGLKVLRYKNSEILNSVEEVKVSLIKEI